MRKLGWVIAVALPLSGQPLLAATGGGQEGQDQQQQGQGQQMQGEQTQAAKGEQKESVTMDQLPPAVQSTFRSEAQGAQVEELSKETQNGKTVYKGEIVKNGEGYKLKVSEEGKVLHKCGPHPEKNEPEHQPQQ